MRNLEAPDSFHLRSTLGWLAARLLAALRRPKPSHWFRSMARQTVSKATGPERETIKYGTSTVTVPGSSRAKRILRRISIMARVRWPSIDYRRAPTGMQRQSLPLPIRMRRLRSPRPQSWLRLHRLPRSRSCPWLPARTTVCTTPIDWQAAPGVLLLRCVRCGNSNRWQHVYTPD